MLKPSLAHASIALLFLAACGQGKETTVVSGTGAPVLELEGPDGAPAWTLVGVDARPAVTVAAGETVHIKVLDPAATLRAGDRVAFDAALAPDAGDGVASGRLALAGAPAITFEVEAHWTTYSFAVMEGTGEWTLELPAGPEEGARVVVAAPRVTRDAEDHPTVVLITSDTHRADHLSAVNPASPVSTPYLDAIAREGVLFTDCFSSTNVTCPSHVALMTGYHPRDSKITHNETKLREVAETLAERYRDAGYQTFAATSTFFLSHENSGLGQGFMRIDAPEESARDGKRTLEIARSWLDDARGAPLFLWVHLYDAHTPYTVPQDIRQRLLAGRPDPYREDASLDLSPEVVPKWITTSGVRDGDFVDALYAGEVEYLDGALGPFLSEPRIADATLAFTSDHGENLGERGLRWNHSGLQRATLEIPLILRGPGAPGGRRVDGPVRQIDLGRTLLEMSGLGAASFPGRDLREGIENPQPLEPRFSLSASALSAAVEHEGWILDLELRNADVDLTGLNYRVGRCSLFDTRSDPMCRSDRIVTDFERALRMRASLLQWLGRAEATGMNAINDEIPPEVTQKLLELGYSGGYESLVKWWSPESMVEGWETDPWNLAFQGDGDPLLLEEFLRASKSGD